MDRNDVAIVTYAEHPDLRDVMDHIKSEPWPEFMVHDVVSNGLWNRLYDVFPEFQFGLLESRTGCLVAMANNIPLAWHGIPWSLSSWIGMPTRASTSNPTSGWCTSCAERR